MLAPWDQVGPFVVGTIFLTWTIYGVFLVIGDGRRPHRSSRPADGSVQSLADHELDSP